MSSDEARFAAMFECQNCGNSVRVGLDFKAGRIELDGGCPDGCSGNRVTLERDSPWGLS